LRRGYDVERAPAGAGNVLLAYTLRDSFARGDRLFDMGVGSPQSKCHFETRLIPVCVTATIRRWRCAPKCCASSDGGRPGRRRTDFLIRPQAT